MFADMELFQPVSLYEVRTPRHCFFFILKGFCLFLVQPGGR